MVKEKDRFERYKNIIAAIIQEHLPGCKKYLFGSRAREIHSEGSDIDIALDDGKPIDIDVLARLQVSLQETNLPLDVDFVDLQSISDELKKEIERDGVLWQE